MKMIPISDLHIHKHNPNVLDYVLKSVLSNKPDVVIDAGDVGYKKQHYDYVKGIIESSGAKYFYVPGNHDRYNEKYETPLKCNFVETINNVRFVFSSLFSKLAVLEEQVIIKNIYDFDYTTKEKIESLHQEAMNFLKENIIEGCVVVTHFAPSTMSITKYWKASGINSFFVSPDCEKLIEERSPKLWIHGHTHNAFDYELYKTRVVCNPLGYAWEVEDFNPNLIIEI